MSIVSSKFKNSHSTYTVNLSHDLFSSNFFKIPDYQRNYSWKKEQIDDLLEDILDIAEAPRSEKLIYLGNLIMLGNDELADDTFEILDGQQRLTSIFLCLNALRKLNNDIKELPDYQDSVESETKKQFSEKFGLDKIERLLWNEGDQYRLGKSSIDSYRINYKNEKENEKYQDVLKKFSNGKSNFASNFMMIYNAFKNFVDDAPLIRNKLEKLIILSSIVREKIYFDFTITKDSTSAYSIFESLNTTGLLLTPFDIVSGKINSGLYKDFSQDFNDICDELVDEKFNITNLLHYYVQIKLADASTPKDQIIAYFNKLSNEKIEDLLVYFQIVLNFKNEYYNMYKLISNLFNRKQLWPFVYGLALYNTTNNNYFLNENDYNLINFLLIFSVYELNILRHSPGGIYKRVINDYIKEVAKNGNKNFVNYQIEKMVDYLKENKISQKDIKTIMSDLDETTKKGFMVYYYLYNNKSTTLEIDLINLEHCYPQKPSIEWENNGWIFEDEVKLKITNSFGNMLLINEKLNKSISNRFIDEKKEKYFAAKDESLKLSSINAIDFERFKEEKEKYINERSSFIIDELLRIDYFSTFIDDNEKE